MRGPLWRVGRTLGRTLYWDGVCVGMVDTPGLAQEIVDAMNDADSGSARRSRIVELEDALREIADGEADDSDAVQFSDWAMKRAAEALRGKS